MDDATKRVYVRIRLAKAEAERIVADAEHFVARLERYLRQVGAIE